MKSDYEHKLKGFDKVLKFEFDIPTMNEIESKKDRNNMVTV